MAREYRTVPAEEVLATFSPRRRAQIAKRAKELIAEEIDLRDLRMAKRVTQEQVARKLGGRQVYISRLENRSDMKISTLGKYLRAMGGELQIWASFPEGAIKLRTSKGKARTRVAKSKAKAGRPSK